MTIEEQVRAAALQRAALLRSSTLITEVEVRRVRVGDQLVPSEVVVTIDLPRQLAGLPVRVRL